MDQPKHIFRNLIVSCTLMACLTANAQTAPISSGAAGREKPDADIPAATAQSPLSLTDRLMVGGLVIYMRHERTTREPVERFSATTRTGCEQSNNPARSAGERALTSRAAIAQMKLPVGKVLSSEYCRSSETARLVFGAEPELTPLLNSVHATAARTASVMRNDALALIGKHAQAGKNLVLVGHREGMLALTGIDVNTGESLVLEMLPNGEPRVIGQISQLRWAQMGADAQRRAAMASMQKAN